MSAVGWLRRAACAAAVIAELAVGARPAHAQYPPVVTRSRLDPAAGVSFHAVLLSDTVYVGQQATYQIGVFLNQETRQRLRRNPEFIPPETRSLLVYDLPDAKAPLVGTIDGRSYEVHVFQRAFFALTPGTYVIPPSQLNYSLPQSASFFSREDTHALRSESRTLVVLPVPLGGRPSSWAGAVGEWRAVLRVDSAKARVGTPVVVTLKVGGLGNVALLPRPSLVVDGATVVPAGERVALDTTPAILRGAKEFDWLVTPRVGGAMRIPSQAYAYFDPIERRYAQATTEPLTVAVSGDAADVTDVDSITPTPAPVPTATPVATLSLREAIGRESPVSWASTPWFPFVILLAPLPALLGWLARRPRRARRAPTVAERFAYDAGRDPASRRTLMHEALRARLGLDAGLLLARGELVTALRHEGVTLETAQRTNAVLRVLDASVFGDGTAGASAAELVALYEAVDKEARGVRRPSTAGAAGRALALLAILAVLRNGALMAQTGAATVQRAREAFASRDFDAAARTYRALARAEPRNADLWANAGTAAFMAADTAHAVEGWQRALRLHPLDVELRDRLALVRAAQDRGAARVLPINAALASIVVLLLWVAGWFVLARRAWRGQRIGRRLVVALAVGAIVFAGLRRLDRAARGVDVAVIAQAEPLRDLPALGAERGVAPLIGEVATVLERRGAWARVRLDGNREGWIATEWLIPLND